MIARKLTPTGIETRPLCGQVPSLRAHVVALIRQHLAAQGSRALEELRANLDRSITEDERQAAIGKRSLKGNHVSSVSRDGRRTDAEIAWEKRQAEKRERKRKRAEELDGEPERFRFPFEGREVHPDDASEV